MRNRFYLPQGLRNQTTLELTGEEFHHAVRVHRSRVGEEIEIFDGVGGGFVGRIEEIGKSSARITILAEADRRDPALDIRLGLALIQMERFELVLQKGTELGVSSFIPLITERSEVRPERVASRLDRWQTILREATKQSGRSRLPGITPPVPFHELIRYDAPRLIFEAEGENQPLPAGADRVLLMIGPEGGWSEGEMEMARAAGCSFHRLGPRRLRAETAAIAAVTVVGTSLGDLSR